MNKRFIFTLLFASLIVSYLVFAAVHQTAKAEVTVSELQSKPGPRKNIRLGARVAEGEIKYTNEAERQLSFFVEDIEGKAEQIIPVNYKGTVPDTLKVGRDVILEGSYNGESFIATSLLTQCPSKYQPPEPGTTVTNKGY